MKNLKLYRGNIMRSTRYESDELKPIMVGFGFGVVHEKNVTNDKEIVKENVQLFPMYVSEVSKTDEEISKQKAKLLRKINISEQKK